LIHKPDYSTVQYSTHTRTHTHTHTHTHTLMVGVYPVLRTCRVSVIELIAFKSDHLVTAVFWYSAGIDVSLRQVI